MTLSEEFNFQSPTWISAPLTAAVVQGDKGFPKETLQCFSNLPSVSRRIYI